MSDSDFIDVGDELVVKISGYPIAKVKVVEIVNVFGKGPRAKAVLRNNDGEHVWSFYLPLDVKDYDTVDGVAHEDLG